ncbi:ferritin-like domain-containing protein [Paraburkholderia sp. BL10I2N1]|uniref:ferritin-like domain-containing protein n=1 Tax=Paraburkholderia sp. BL10I2N1 TaxID=1938796 RepID=UPI0010622A7F|nr:ferritin-like domain-containing protein [Paraburkholderia sp. BL10I2N1]TDN57741.1 bacterioferritin [Paraburkholderia sp. BL10I2N1]
MSKSSVTQGAASKSPDPFVMDVQKIREHARKHMSDGPVTETYGADRETVVKLLNDALATEIICTLRYKRHYFMAKGINSDAVADEFAQHAVEEQGHADMIAQRIVQLGGAPDFAPDRLTSRAHSEYKEGANLVDMIRENLIAERIAIDTYREFIRYLGDNDTTTRRLFEAILAVEEEHADDMADLLGGRE